MKIKRSLTGWTVKNVPNTLLFANSSDLWAIFFLTIIEKVLYISQIQFLRIESIEVKLVRHKQTETNFKYQSLIFAQSQISALAVYLTYWECFDIDVCVLLGSRISIFLPSQGLLWGKFWDILVKVNLFIQKTDQPILWIYQFIGIIVSSDQLHIIGIECMTHIIHKVMEILQQWLCQTFHWTIGKDSWLCSNTARAKDRCHCYLWTQVLLSALSCQSLLSHLPAPNVDLLCSPHHLLQIS